MKLWKKNNLVFSLILNYFAWGRGGEMAKFPLVNRKAGVRAHSDLCLLIESKAFLPCPEKYTASFVAICSLGNIRFSVRNWLFVFSLADKWPNSRNRFKIAGKKVTVQNRLALEFFKIEMTIFAPFILIFTIIFVIIFRNKSIKRRFIFTLAGLRP